MLEQPTNCQLMFPQAHNVRTIQWLQRCRTGECDIATGWIDCRHTNKELTHGEEGSGPYTCQYSVSCCFWYFQRPNFLFAFVMADVGAICTAILQQWVSFAHNSDYAQTCAGYGVSWSVVATRTKIRCLGQKNLSAVGIKWPPDISRG